METRNRLYLLMLFVATLTCNGQSNMQSSSDNWIVYLNKDTIPLRPHNDSGYIAHVANPATDYLTLTKMKGSPAAGQIHFYEGKDYPLPLTSYTLGKAIVIKLKDIAENYRKSVLNKLKVEIVEISDRTIKPIIVIEFRTK